MIERWRKMSPGERLRAQIVFAFLMLGVYGLVFYPISRKKLDHAEQMLHRRQDRIDKRANIDNLSSKGLNPKVIQKKIDEARKKFKALSQDFDELDTGFAPVDSADVKRQLMLEISTLADRTGVNLVSVVQKGVSLTDEGTSVYLDPQVKRPLLDISAQAKFWDLIDFLNGLKELSFYVSVMNLKLYADPPRGNNDDRLPGGALYIYLQMSM
nr:hypothetical protein [uncultured Desulfobacter sp.]